MAARGFPLTVVTEEVEPPELFDWFVQSRTRLGMEVIPLGPHTAADVSRALANNRIVCLLCDRDLTGAGITVDFFGEPTTVPGGPALLALRTGAALLPCGGVLHRRRRARREGRGTDSRRYGKAASATTSSGSPPP